MSVCALVEILHNLLRGFELHGVSGEVYLVLVLVDEICVCLPCYFDGFLARLLFEDVLRQLS